jgi:hypothetical protein
MWTRFKAAVVTVVDAPSDALEQVALVILCLARSGAPTANLAAPTRFDELG